MIYMVAKGEYMFYTAPDMTISHKHGRKFFTNRYRYDFVQFFAFSAEMNIAKTLVFTAFPRICAFPKTLDSDR